MVRFVVFVCFLLSVPAALAGELRIKVVDPRSASVAGAVVSVYRVGDTAPLQVRTSAGDGVALFDVDTSLPLRAEVLAAGFAVASIDVPSSASSATGSTVGSTCGATTAGRKATTLESTTAGLSTGRLDSAGFGGTGFTLDLKMVDSRRAVMKSGSAGD
jgi:hypothetical protein